MLSNDGRVRLELASQAQLASIQAVASECHENCRRWIAANPGDRIMRGWLRTSIATEVKHSAIHTADGRYLDVTPRLNEQGETLLDFIECQWTDKEFAGEPASRLIVADPSGPTRSPLRTSS